MRVPRMKKDGFSLIEVVFALGLFAMGILAASQLANMVMKTNKMARNYTTALLLAQNKMEEIKTLAYGELAPGEAVDSGTFSAGHRGDFQRMVRVRVQGNPPCKIVEVTVTWTERMRRQVVLASIVAP